MSIARSQRLRIPSHYYVYCDPPDAEGIEVLHFVSPQRRVKLKGHSFREFVQNVVPLLDGRHEFEELHAEVADLFEREDLEECLDLLTEQGVLEDTAELPLDEAAEQRLRPQLNLFHDISAKPWELQERLVKSCVAVFGMTGAGANAARALRDAGVGRLLCMDPEAVASADVYLGGFATGDIGKLRAEALGGGEARCERLTSDEAVERAIAGSDFVVNCLDEGNLALMYRLNRVCLKTKTPWVSAAAAGFEIVIGPAVYPGETACYMCYRMRLVACADNPEASFDFESYLDRRRRDDSTTRANLAAGAAIAGQMAAVEVVKALTGISRPASRGKVVVLDLREMKTTTHVVLRKPWCPACSSNEAVR